MTPKQWAIACAVVAAGAAGAFGYVWHHDSTGAEAYVRVEKQHLSVPNFMTGEKQSIDTYSLVVNDFTYFDKHPAEKVTMTLDGKEYHGHAFHAGTLPPPGGTSSLKHAQVIVLRLPDKLEKAIEAASSRTLTFQYSDGTTITKDIQVP